MISSREGEKSEEDEEVYVGVVRLLREEGVSERASERVRGLETPRRGNFSIWLLFFLSLGKTLDSSPSAVNFPSLSLPPSLPQPQLVVRATDWLHWSKLKW